MRPDGFREADQNDQENYLQSSVDALRREREQLLDKVSRAEALIMVLALPSISQPDKERMAKAYFTGDLP